MNEGIQRLRELQRILLELRRVEAERDGLPGRREALEARKEETEARLQEIRDRMEERDRDRRKSELELKSLEDRLQHYKDQLMEVKTNKEYHALQHEIELVKEKISGLETRVLTEMDEADTDSVALEKAQKERDRAMAEATEEEAAIAQREEKIGGEIGFLEEERGKLEGSIPKEILDRFQRVAAVRDGVGMVEARDAHCTACQTPVRPQVWHELRHTDQVVSCDNCGRILFHAVEDAGD